MHIFDLLHKIKTNKKSILVFGDAIYDNYVIGDVNRFSPEAPVPILIPRVTEWRLGGAANVFNNIISASGKATICTVIGNDPEGEAMKSKLSLLNQSENLIFIDETRRTTKKTRYITEGKHLLRVDEEDGIPISETLFNNVYNKIKDLIDDYDILLISDYAKGFILENLITQIIKLFTERKKIVLTDPKTKNIEKYSGSYLIKPNQNEFLIFIDEKNPDLATPYIVTKGKELLKKSNAEYMYITLGEKGGLLIGNSIEPKFILPHGNKAIDITGAGDSVIAAIALALSSGSKIEDAVEFASYAAGVCVQKTWTTPFRLEEIEQLLIFEKEHSHA